jgi:hypothetical protein
MIFVSFPAAITVSSVVLSARFFLGSDGAFLGSLLSVVAVVFMCFL